MKILFITNNLEAKDGWSRYSYDYISALANLNNEVLCVVNKKADIDISQTALLENPLRYLSYPFLCFISALKIQKIINDFKPDIIHVMVEPYIHIFPFIKLNGGKLVVTIHGSYSYIPALVDNFFSKIIAKVLTKLALKKSVRIISISMYTKNYLQKNLFLPEDKIKVIGNGIDLEKFKFNIIKAEKKTKKILFVGAFKPRKGIIEALKGLKKYFDKFEKNAIFFIIGDYKESDNYFKNILEYIEKNGLNENVKIMGCLSEDELLSYYQEADLFLMPSINDGRFFEGFGLVYLEANAFGVPCIGPNDSGAADAIKNAKSGFLVNPLDSEDIAEKINDILNKKMIKPEDCLSWASLNSIDKKADELLKIYKS